MLRASFCTLCVCALLTSLATMTPRRSMLLFDFHPTTLFGAGVATTAASVWLYARPDDLSACMQKLASSLSGRPQGAVVATRQRDSNEKMGKSEANPKESEVLVVKCSPDSVAVTQW